MSKNEPQNQKTPPAAPRARRAAGVDADDLENLESFRVRDGARSEGPAHTHLLVQSRRDRFKRAGIETTRTPRAIRLADLTPEQVERLESQKDEIITRRLTAEEAARVNQGAAVDDGCSRAELIQQIQQLEGRNAQLESENQKLRQAAGGDRPPADGAALVGAIPPPLPVPPEPRAKGTPAVTEQPRTPATTEPTGTRNPLPEV